MFFDASRRIVLVLLDVEDGTEVPEIKTECGVTVAPIPRAEVIVYLSDSHCKVVFEAVYGALPDGTLVVAAKNGSDAFPNPLSEPDLKTKILLNPYQVVCDAVDVIEPKLVLWMGGCPICGKLKNEDIDAFEFDADDEGDDEGDDTGGDEGGDDDPADDPTLTADDDEEEPVEIPMPRRWSMEMLNPSLN